MEPNWCGCNRGPGARPPLLGRNRDGTWRSAAAKAYPTELNYILARSFSEVMRRRWMGADARCTGVAHRRDLVDLRRSSGPALRIQTQH
eukprot:4187767-Pyramimonas_sp.AAC.1